MDNMDIAVGEEKELNQLFRNANMAQGMNELKDRSRCKKAKAGNHDGVRFGRDQKGVIDPLPAGIEIADGKGRLSGIREGEEEPEEYDKTVHDQ